jgi:hypothetical protein
MRCNIYLYYYYLYHHHHRRVVSWMEGIRCVCVWEEGLPAGPLSLPEQSLSVQWGLKKNTFFHYYKIQIRRTKLEEGTLLLLRILHTCVWCVNQSRIIIFVRVFHLIAIKTECYIATTAGWMDGKDNKRNLQ